MIAMNRRGFLGSILALSAAPAIVRADSLMRIVPRDALVGSIWPGKFFCRAITDEEMWMEASGTFPGLLSINYADQWGNENETKVTFARCAPLIYLT